MIIIIKKIKERCAKMLRNETFNKWVMELANEEYAGNLKELNKVL